MRVMLMIMRAVGWRNLGLLLLAGLAAACSCTRSSGTQPAGMSLPTIHEVPVQVTSVGFDQDTGQHYVLLEDKDETRDLPIIIGPNEATAIEFALNNVQPPRPMTHDLLKAVIQQTGNDVDRVLICDMRDEVYYAKIFMDHGRYTIDSRPSDAIALATEMHAPIYVSDKLFDAPASIGKASVDKLPDTATAYGVTVQQLTPEIAAYFGISHPHGVLVSDVDPAAASCGIERGDVVTRIGNRDVKALGDFNADLASVARESPVTFTVLRDGTDHTIKFDGASER
jgi:uncharacterized protein